MSALLSPQPLGRTALVARYDRRVHRLRLAAGGLAALAGACTRSLDLGSNVLWSAAHETGDLSEWLEPPGGGSHTDTGSLLSTTSQLAHGGQYAVELLSSNVSEQADDGPALRRFVPGGREAYYSAWYYLPTAYSAMDTTWTIQKFTSLGAADAGLDADVEGGLDAGPDAADDAASEAGADAASTDDGGDPAADPTALRQHIDLNLRPLPSGEIVLQVFGHTPSILEPPLALPPPVVPVGRWFQIETLYRPATDATGRVVVWLDGREVYDVENRVTSENLDVYWLVCNFVSGLVPSPPVIYVDDAAISLTRVTPNGILRYPK